MSGRFFWRLLTRDEVHAKRNGTVDIAGFKQGQQAGRVFGGWHGFRSSRKGVRVSYIHIRTRRRLPCQRKLHTIPRMKKSAPLSIRITPTLKDALERLAEADKRSLASYVEIALQAHVDAVERKPSRGSRK